ncbi:MAG: hypothetical protein ASARMPREDX12_002215 [Alectoria sarmentosa]|nr:MAG: hypothetical protein ASARMPREDX12_002215 [Alectoria sarmentosa]
MALASAPSTPERATPPPFIRRSFTAPIRPSRSIPVSEETVDGAETLYAHGAGKIVSFNNLTSLARRHSSISNGRAELQEEPVGTLPWFSTTERTLAAGPLRIYRVLGTAFLNSGTTLQPLLSKSQCWCVDGESKFVLRIRPNAYYRIELPRASSEDKKKVDDFKNVLTKVLQYEVTPCPFKRGFTIDLPQPPRTPVQKRPWRPKPLLDAMSEKAPEVLEDCGDFSTTGMVTRSPDAGKRDLVEPDLATNSGKKAGFPVAHSDVSNTGSMKKEGSSEATDDTGFTHKDLQENVYQEPDDFKTPTRPKGLRTGRAITAPPQLTLRTSLPSTKEAKSLALPKLKRVSSSLSSSMESFHSFHSPTSPLAPSPPFPTSLGEDDAGVDVPPIRNHKRDISEITVTASSPELWDMSDAKSGDESTYHSPPDVPGTPPLVSDAASQDDDHWPEPTTPSPHTKIRRHGIRRRTRNRSPLPSSSNLYSPYSPRSHMSGHHMTTAILQKTCSLLLGPPIQLVALMMRIAAKIARGASRGTSFGFGDGGQKIPCSWDFSDASDEADEDWEEDDYGVILCKHLSSRDARAGDLKGGSWEID